MSSRVIVALLVGCGRVPVEPPETPKPEADPAALIVALRTDGFVDQDHGNHSPTMKALEIVGEPALPSLDAALTDTVVASADPDDTRFALSVVMVMGRIDPEVAVAPAVRLARSPGRGAAIGALLTLLGQDIWMGRMSIGDPFSIPWPIPDADPPDIAAALQPHEADLASLAEASTTDPYVRFLAAQVLVRYGSPAVVTRGEAQLVAALADPAFSWKADIIDAVGTLEVSGPSDAVAAVTDPALLGHAAWALLRLDDPRYADLATRALEAEDPEVRRAAIGVMANSRNVAFVPALIAHLDDQGPNGTTTSSTPPGGHETTVVHVLGEDCAAALKRLTFARPADDRDPGVWKAFAASHVGQDWEALLRARIADDLAALPSLAPWEINVRLEGLADVVDPAVLPLLTAVLARPDLDVSAEGPNTFRSGGPPPVGIALLHALAHGDPALPETAEARAMLVGAMESRDTVVQSHAVFAVATFDRVSATDRFAADLAKTGCDLWPAMNLTELGDARGVPELIGCLADPFGANGSLAAGTLTRYTRMTFPFDEDAAVEVRAEQAARWQEWWATAGPTFAIDLRAVAIDGENYR